MWHESLDLAMYDAVFLFGALAGSKSIKLMKYGSRIIHMTRYCQSISELTNPRISLHGLPRTANFRATSGAFAGELCCFSSVAYYAISQSP